MKSPIQKIIFDRNGIQSKVKRIARKIVSWFRNKNEKTLNLVSVLEGARPFTRDLVKTLKKLMPEVEIKNHEIRVIGTKGTKLLKNRKWRMSTLDAKAIRQFPVLIMDDLVDSGLTLQTLRKEILNLGAPEVKNAVFLRKYKSHRGPVDFCGIELGLNHKKLAQKGIKDYWLFGYGMDLNGKHRKSKKIGWVEIR
jgi:hypoxanthine phosphoribosyltransferase